MSGTAFEIFPDRNNLALDLHFNLEAQNVLDLIATALRIGNRNSREDWGRYSFGRGKAGDRAWLKMHFEDLNDWHHANDMANGIITKTGRLKSSELGALEYVDPKRVQSRAALALLKDMKPSN